ncbi:MAG: AbrB/MazE/SpoVT family DNA-binding domain-containing protein [Halobacteriota archaeon]
MDNESERRAGHQRVLVKGYMRPDGTSYYVVIPKKIRESFNLKGGEYFVMKAKPERSVILLKLVEFADEEFEAEPETK